MGEGETEARVTLPTRFPACALALALWEAIKVVFVLPRKLWF